MKLRHNLSSGFFSNFISLFLMFWISNMGILYASSKFESQKLSLKQDT